MSTILIPERFSKRVLHVGAYIVGSYSQVASGRQFRDSSTSGARKATLHVFPERLRSWEWQLSYLFRQGFQSLILADHIGVSPLIAPTDPVIDHVGHLLSFKVVPDGSHAVIKVELHDLYSVLGAMGNKLQLSPEVYDDGGEWRDLLAGFAVVDRSADHSQGGFIHLRGDNGN